MAETDIPYTLYRSSRRTVSLEIDARGRVLVRAPKGLSQRAIREFVASRESWLREKLRKYENRPMPPLLTPEELETLKARARGEFPQRAARFAPRLGVTWGRICIRAQRSRWGSCSRAGNLNFNCLLMLAPEEVRDYVVVHELCHRICMDHSARFWAQVEHVMPDYRLRRQWLKDHGSELLARLPE